MGVICDKSTATLYPDLTKKYLITEKNGFFIAVAEQYLYSYEPTWQKITTCTHHCNQKSLDKKHRYTSVSISVRQKLICVNERQFTVVSFIIICMCGFQKKKAGALSETHGRSRMYTLTDRLPTYWIYLVFMNISYSLFTNEIAKLFDSEFENEDHVMNMPFLKDACVSIKIYGTDEMFFTIDNDVKEPCNLNRAWIIQENKKISANWPTIILKSLY